jgi:hypothetical protein
MPTTTTRLALIKPAGGETVKRTDITTSFDILDEFAGCILVNDGVTPGTADLFDGALVKERTSGIIWEARKNGGGTFDKVYVRYPYQYRATTPITDTVGTGAVYGGWGATTVDTAQCKNASAAQKNGSNFWVCPVKGLYSVRLRFCWNANAAGLRGLKFTLNGTADPEGGEMVVTPVAGFYTATEVHMLKLLAVNDIVGTQTFQSSGGNLGTAVIYEIDMIEPIQ